MQKIKASKKGFHILLISAAVFVFCINNNKTFAQTQPQKIFFKDTLPRPVGYVNDFAFLYSAAQRQELENMMGNFEDSTTAQIVVITFSAGTVPRDSLEALTIGIGNAWGIGKKETNNGVVIGISPEHRKMTIRNGLGIEKVLSDAETKEIIDKNFLPQFKEAKYFEGTVAGLQALIEILTKKFKEQ